MATLSSLLQTFATSQNDILTRLYLGLLMPKDEILNERAGIRGLEIYSEIERDAHAYSVLNKRKMAPLAHPLEFEPASKSSKDKAAAEFVKGILKPTIDDCWVALADGLLKGFAVVEVIWDVKDGAVVPLAYKAIDQRRFIFKENLDLSTGWEIRLRTFEAPLEGIEVPPRKFIVFTFGSRDGSPYGIGLGQKLYWPAYFKRGLAQFWLDHAERYASPIVAGGYPTGFSSKDIDDYLQRLQEAASRGAVAYPAGMEIKNLLPGNTADIYERAVRYWDEEMSKAVLGETLTTTMGDVGSYAASQTHNEVRLELAQSDSIMFCTVLNETIVHWVVELNLPGAKPPIMKRKVEVPADLQAEADKDQKLSEIGFKPTQERITRVYGEGYEKAEPPAQLEPFAGKKPGQLQEGGDGKAQETPKPKEKLEEGADDFAEGKGGESINRQISRALGGADFSELVDPIRKIVKQARNLEDLRDKIDAAFPKLSAKDFQEAMAEAFMVATITGRYDVLKETGSLEA